MGNIEEQSGGAFDAPEKKEVYKSFRVGDKVTYTDRYGETSDDWTIIAFNFDGVVTNADPFCALVQKSGVVRSVTLEELLEQNGAHVSQESNDMNDLLKGFNIDAGSLAEDLLDGVFKVEQTIEVDGKVFFLGPIYHSGKYFVSVMYSCVPDSRVPAFGGRVVPRLVYRSVSQGKWRSAPSTFYREDKKERDYSKGGEWGNGVSHSYREMTVLDERLARVFELKIQNNKFVEDEGIVTTIKESFDTARVQADGILTLNEEMELDRTEDMKSVDTALKPFLDIDYKIRRYLDKEAQQVSNEEAAAIDIESSLPDFVPDFSERNIVKTTKVDHSRLGECTVEVYDSRYGNETFEWQVTYDKEGRVWFSVSPKVYDVTSYGFSDLPFNTGALSFKPLEYRSSCEGLEDGSQKIEFDEKYYDVTPFIDQYRITKKFREERGIYRSGETASEIAGIVGSVRDSVQ